MRLMPISQQEFPQLDAVRLDAIRVTAYLVTRFVSSRATRTCCPLCPVCHHWSRHMHGRFVHTLAAPPCAGQAVLLHLSGRRFFCEQRTCRRRTFRE